MKRTMEESMALIDKIIGRCIREADFAARVLDDPHTALVEYGLNAAELSDFIALKRDHRDDAAQTWARVRVIHER